MLKPPEHPGIELEKRIREQDMSYADFARAIDVSPSRISELVSGKRSLSIDSAYKIAQAFNMDIEYWLSKQMKYDIHKEVNK